MKEGKISKHLVWRHYDQHTLDLECNPSLTIENAEGYLIDYADRSRRTRELSGNWFTARYGDGPRQQLDIFKSTRPSAPVQIFIHGGGWHLLSKDENSFVADGFVPHGVTVVVISYSQLPGVALDAIPADIYAAINWVHANAVSFDGDPDRLYVSGHSAGAHLAAMAIAEQGASVPPGLIKGALLVSGNYDLEPLRLSARNRVMNIDAAAAARNSPALRIPRTPTPTDIAWGEHESLQYKAQARELALAWGKAGVPCRKTELRGVNHLQAPLQLADAQSPLIRLALRQMGIAVDH